MSVKVNIHWNEWQGEINGHSVVEVNGSTTGECLRQLIEQFPPLKKEIFDKDGALLGYLTIFVNKEPAFPNELTRSVKDGDEIHIVPLVAGG